MSQQRNDGRISIEVNTLAEAIPALKSFKQSKKELQLLWQQISERQRIIRAEYGDGIRKRYVEAAIFALDQAILQLEDAIFQNSFEQPFNRQVIKVYALKKYPIASPESQIVEQPEPEKPKQSGSLFVRVFLGVAVVVLGLFMFIMSLTPSPQKTGISVPKSLLTGSPSPTAKPASSVEARPAQRRRSSRRTAASHHAQIDRTYSVQCRASTKRGTRCSRMTLSPNGRCWQHGGN